MFLLDIKKKKNQGAPKSNWHHFLINKIKKNVVQQKDLI